MSFGDDAAIGCLQLTPLEVEFGGLVLGLGTEQSCLGFIEGALHAFLFQLGVFLSGEGKRRRAFQVVETTQLALTERKGGGGTFQCGLSFLDSGGGETLHGFHLPRRNMNEHVSFFYPVAYV